MRAICAVHQGYELYGSDRSFIQCVNILRGIYPAAEITVLLPQRGSLAEVLEADGFTVRVEDLWILRKSYGVGLIGRLLILPLALWRAHRNFQRSDLVHINTAVVADYLLAARLHPGKAVAHIREIPTGLARKLVEPLVRWSRAALFFNSQATAEAFGSAPGVVRAVIHNGFEGPADARPPASRNDGRLRLLMLGRINDWKGQDFLVEVISQLPKKARDAIDLRIVGDAFEGQPYRRDLEARVRALGLQGQVVIEGFVEDVTPHLRWADAVAAPSRKPEPFGRVAIEAMAWARPVVAARHGGLVEIVEHGFTGLLFAPNDAEALGAALLRLVTETGLATRLGEEGRRQYQARFTEAALADAFAKALVRAGFGGARDG